MKIYLLSLVCFLVGYLICNLHPAYLLGKIVKNVDIRQEGSNNSGASNVSVVLGFKYGVITAAIDILKGVIAVAIVRFLICDSVICLYSCYLGCIFGHIFPCFLKFAGGKGLATLLGVCLSIDFKFGFLLALLLVFVTVLTQYIALGTLSVVTVFFAYTIYLYGLSYPSVVAGVIFAVMVAKHMINIKRIRNGEEVKLFESFKKKK